MQQDNALQEQIQKATKTKETKKRLCSLDLNEFEMS